MLVPDRVYKENRANWNANYQQADGMKHGNANWSLPAWQETPSRMWNQSNQSNQIKSSRKVSAKQHYLSVARYVAGQSTNLPSRYRKFRNLLERILIMCTMLILCHVLVRSHLGQDMFSGRSINLLELAPLGKNHSQTAQSYDTIVQKSISTLIDLARHLIALLMKILSSLDVFPNISELLGFVRRVSWYNFGAVYLSYSYPILMIHFAKYLCQVKRFVIMTNLFIWMDEIARSFALRVTRALRHILTILF